MKQIWLRKIVFAQEAELRGCARPQGTDNAKQTCKEHLQRKTEKNLLTGLPYFSIRNKIRVSLSAATPAFFDPPTKIKASFAMTRKYYAPTGGLPGQEQITTDRAVFTEAYAVIPKGVMRDIVTSFLPFWDHTRLWVIARPLSGFAETFSQYVMEVGPNGGSEHPEADLRAEAVLFVVEGSAALKVEGATHSLGPGGYAYLPPGTGWALRNRETDPLRFHWIRKSYEPVEGLPLPEAFVTNEQDIDPISMPGTGGKWSTTRFVDPTDLRHDMHVNIVNLEPGAVIPFAETHVMEHGLYVLEGKAVYLLNRDWVEVEAGDYMWLRAFCPQACYASGPGRFRYLLYKDVNRHMALRPQP